jgi:hypothetical protein
MAPKTSYKFFSANPEKVNQELAKYSGWKPILMTATHTVQGPGGIGSVIVYVVLESPQ